MFILRKRNGRLVSPRKELMEQMRVRQNYERRLALNLDNEFARIGDKVADDLNRGDSNPVTLDFLEIGIGEILVNHYRSVIDAFGTRILTLDAKQSRFERIIQQYVLIYGSQKISLITNTTRRLITQIIATNIAEGIALPAIASQIKEFMRGAFTRNRSRIIARTETHNASSYANHIITKEQNVPNQQKRWISTNDGRTRSHHSNLNGTTIPIDEDFIVPYRGINYRMSYPSDPRGGPANIINCRCVLAYIVPEDDIL